MAEKEVKSFVLHNCTLNVLDKLTDEQCGKLFRMIKAWQTKDMETFEELNADITLSLVFVPFETQFKIDEAKYKQVSERQRKRIKDYWERKKTKQEVSTEYHGIPRNTTVTTEYHNDNDNVNDNDNDVNTTYGSDNSNIDNNNISHTNVRAHVREGITIEEEEIEPYEGYTLGTFDVEAFAEREQNWCEVFCMNNRITKEMLKSEMLGFVSYLQDRAITYKERKDFKAHFANWYNITKKAEKNGRSKKFTATEERDKCIEERNSLQFARLVQLNEQAKKRKGNCTG